MISKEYTRRQLSILDKQEHRNEKIKLNLLQLATLVFCYIVISPIPTVHIDFISLDLSIRVNVVEIFYYYAVYAMVVLNLNILSYEDSTRITELIVSTLAGWYFVCYADIGMLVSYYLYDLFLMIKSGDWIMVAHHLFTIWGISHTAYYPDYHASILTVQLIKRGDILLHAEKIIKKMFNPKYKFVNYARCIVSAYTAISMTYHRLYLIYFVNYHSVLIKGIMLVFTILACYWIIKVYHTTFTLAKKLYL